jgi:protein subunit release factor B
MNLTEAFDVSPGKVAALLERISALRIDPAAIEEQFVKGGGPGGSKINTTSNAVLLRYAPLGIVVRCQQDRRRTVNRFLALRELVDRIEERVSPGTSERLREIERRRRSKARAGRRARAKHRGPTPPADPPA